MTRITWPWIPLLAVALPALAATAQDPADPPEPDPALEERIDLLEDAWKDRRQRRDAEATAIVRELADRLRAPIHPKDRSKIAKAFTAVLTSGRLRPPDAIEPYRAAIDGLATLGDDGADVLVRIYERKRFPHHADWAPMREILIEAIGKTGSADAVPFLVERVQRSGEDGELRAAGGAMARFESASERERKEMVEILAQRLAGFEAQAAAPAVNQDQQLNLDRESAERTLRAVRSGWLQSLRALTGEELETGAAWQRWYQDNKRKPWPDRPDKD